MDNYKCQPETIVEAKNIDSQNDIRGQNRSCIHDEVDEVLGTTGGIDSSLLFFFLILVVIVCQSDCGIEMDTLLWFFLLLVVLFNQNNIF